MDPKRIVVLSPSYGSPDPEHMDACRKLRGVPILRQYGCSAVDQARAYSASLGLEETDADVLFWIDSDIVFDPEDVWRLSELCLNGYDLIGGAYAKKTPGGGIVASFLPNTPSVLRFFEGGQVLEVRGLGFGFLAIHRKVFERLADSFPLLTMTDRKVRGWFIPEADDGYYRSEDYSFIDRARHAGFKIWLDTTVRLYHKGYYAYGLEDIGQVIPAADRLDVTVSVPQTTLTEALEYCLEHGGERLRERVQQAHDTCLSHGDLYPVDDMAAAYVAVRALDKQIVGEAGSGTGYSAACLAAGGAGVVSFDESAEWQDKARKNVERLNWGQDVVFSEMTADAEFPGGMRFDLFLIDSTDETRFKVLPNLVAQGHVGPETEILIHDAFRPGERAILDSWVKQFPGSHWEMVLSKGRGVARFHLVLL